MNLVYCDNKGKVYDDPSCAPAFRSGRSFCRVERSDLIKLPFGSFFFALPGRRAVYFDDQDGDYKVFFYNKGRSREFWAASAFLSSGYLRTYLPAYVKTKDAPDLSLWAYSGVVFHNDEFFVPAIRIDKDKRSDPAIHQNDPQLKKDISRLTRLYANNRLVRQLAYCATEYRCLCARNFFLGRHEAPIPTSPACNAQCLGCLSYQPKTAGFKSSQQRLNFEPTPSEISEVIVHHLQKVKKGVASFGQGCEGEPILRGKDLAVAIKQVRNKTDKGTININTNGSLPKMARLLIDAGLDSIRISANSLNKKYYYRYFKPKGYEFEKDVLKTIEISLNAGIFVSLNLFCMPGVTDSESESEALFEFLKKYPVSMIQMRNFNIDPDFYLDHIEFDDSPPIGMRNLVKTLEENYPKLRLGYYNPALRD